MVKETCQYSILYKNYDRHTRGVKMTNKTAEQNSERQQKFEKLLEDITESQRVNLVGLEFL